MSGYRARGITWQAPRGQLPAPVPGFSVVAVGKGNPWGTGQALQVNKGSPGT